MIKFDLNANIKIFNSIPFANVLIFLLRPSCQKTSGYGHCYVFNKLRTRILTVNIDAYFSLCYYIHELPLHADNSRHHFRFVPRSKCLRLRRVRCVVASSHLKHARLLHRNLRNQHCPEQSHICVFVTCVAPGACKRCEKMINGTGFGVGLADAVTSFSRALPTAQTGTMNLFRIYESLRYIPPKYP